MYFQDIRLEQPVYFNLGTSVTTEHELHTHEALEICVLLENESIFRILDKDYSGKPGDVFMYRPFEPHWNFVRDPAKPMKYITVLFSPSVAGVIPEGYAMLAPFYMTDLLSPHIPADTECARTIRAASLLASREQETKLPGWQAKVIMCLIDVLVSIYRLYHDNHKARGTDKQSEPGIIRAIEYMLSHLADDIDIDYAITLSQLGKTAFYRGFKRLTSLTPNHFVSRLRLQTATYLLEHTDKQVTDIAFECGFHSLSFFNRQFKLYRGISPREYRGQLNSRNER